MNRLAFARGLSLIVILACFVLITLDRAAVFGTSLRPTTTLLYSWTILLGAFVLTLGAVNVVWVHLRHVQAGRTGWLDSLALLVIFCITLVTGLVAPNGMMSPPMEWLFDNVIAPGQAALFAVTFFFLAAAAYRYLRFDRPGGGWLLIGALLMLISQLPAAAPVLPAEVVATTVWLLETPAMAALRGVLLGAALAAIFVGLRTIVGRG
ncbi:MAG: hypothetical protein KDD92_09670 [Caldilineaceae bacterium]|nr:hypothetical protein [Caldilineaceae bacterium]